MSTKARPVRSWIKVSSAPAAALLVMAILLALLNWTPVVAEIEPLLAAWERAKAAGEYDFAAEVRHHVEGPRPQHVHAYLEGQAMPPERAQAHVWLNSAEPGRPDAGFRIRVEGEQVWANAGRGWEPIDELSPLALVQGDYSFYISAAGDVRDLGERRIGRRVYRHCAFRLDGPRLAEMWEARLNRRLEREGLLSSNMRVQVSDALRDLDGQGEIWIDDDGYPARQHLSLRIAQLPGGGSMWQEMDVSFSGFDGRASSAAHSKGQATDRGATRGGTRRGRAGGRRRRRFAPTG